MMAMLPCPTCGQDGGVDHSRSGLGWSGMCTSLDRGPAGCVMGPSAATPSEAVELWNDMPRNEVAVTTSGIVCAHCRNPVDGPSWYVEGRWYHHGCYTPTAAQPPAPNEPASTVHLRTVALGPLPPVMESVGYLQPAPEPSAVARGWQDVNRARREMEAEAHRLVERIDAASSYLDERGFFQNEIYWFTTFDVGKLLRDLRAFVRRVGKP